jgi:hypothetical protein
MSITRVAFAAVMLASLGQALAGCASPAAMDDHEILTKGYGDASQLKFHGSGSSGSSGSGSGFTVQGFENGSTAYRLIFGTVLVPYVIVFSPFFVLMDVMSPGADFTRTENVGRVFAAYGKAWWQVLSPVGYGAWVGGKFVLYDAPVAAGGWAGPPLWTGVKSVFYVGPAAAVAWIGNGFHSRNPNLESAYDSLDKGDNLEAARRFREELAIDRANAAARRGLGKATNGIRDTAEQKGTPPAPNAPPAVMSSSGVGAGLGVPASNAGAGLTGGTGPGAAAGGSRPADPGAGPASVANPAARGTAPAGTSDPGGTDGTPAGQPGAPAGPAGAAAAGTSNRFPPGPGSPTVAGYPSVHAGQVPSAMSQLLDTAGNSLKANAAGSMMMKPIAGTTFDAYGTRNEGSSTFVKAGRSGPPEDIRIPDRLKGDPDVLRLNAYREKEQQARAAAMAAQAKYEEEKRRNPGSNQLTVLLVQAREAEDRTNACINMEKVLTGEVKRKITFEKIDTGPGDKPATGVPPPPVEGK